MTVLENGPKRYAEADESRPRDGRERENGHKRVHASFIGRWMASTFRHSSTISFYNEATQSCGDMQKQGRRA